MFAQLMKLAAHANTEAAMLHSEYLLVLEHARSLKERLLADELRGQVAAFLVRRWMVADGHLTSILVPIRW